MIYCEPELKEQIIKLHIQDGRTYQSLSDEFGFSTNVIRRWVKNYKQAAKEDADRARHIAEMEELRRMQKELEELRKENDFLKKAAAFFAKENK